MGSDDHYPEEAPARDVEVDGFWIDASQLSNRDFAAFAHETGYVTVAERPLDPADFPGLDPRQPQFKVPRKVIKGGSFLCADSYCLRYRPAARRPQMIDTGMSHIGFRCVST